MEVELYHKNAAASTSPTTSCIHVCRLMHGANSRTYRVHTLESPALGSVTSSTANGQSLRAIKRACLCGRPPVDPSIHGALASAGPMWWTSMPGQGWHHDSSALSIRIHILQTVTTNAIPALSPSFTFPVISPAGTSPPDKSATVPSQTAQ